MACRLGGLFSIGEDFDDEDLLGTDWSSSSASGSANMAADASPRALRASSVSHHSPEEAGAQLAGERSTPACNGPASRSNTHTTAGQTALGLRQLSSSSSHPDPPALNHSHPSLAPQRRDTVMHAPPPASIGQDDFDDWDVDLADLDECEGQMGAAPPLPVGTAAVPTAQPSSSTKMLRPSSCRDIQTPPGQPSCGVTSSGPRLPPRAFSVPRVQPPKPSPPPLARPGFTGTSASPSTFSRTVHRPQNPHKPCVAPRPPRQTHSLFETISAAPPCPPLVSPHPLHTPVLTNRLVQLVSASTKGPLKRPRSDPRPSRTRRFPGPAGLLPHQPQHQNLDRIVVSAPQTPAHGVMARLPSQASSSQTEEEDFSGGPWAAMKAEMGLDERNPSCFLHSYSVVMVLRKAALKQLARNKVPNMAVFLKSIIHTQADAKAVFKDPTGEIQGTVHRRLLEDRVEELKVGAVLLLKQVGVFSPSHRNHYLNVTPNNLLRIYTPDTVCSASSSWLPPLVLEPVSPAQPPGAPQGPVSRMQLVFDEDDDVREGQKGSERITDPAAGPSVRGPPQHSEWEADDDLDQLLGELQEESYSL